MSHKLMSIVDGFTVMVYFDKSALNNNTMLIDFTVTKDGVKHDDYLYHLSNTTRSRVLDLCWRNQLNTDQFMTTIERARMIYKALVVHDNFLEVV